ncbi:hypothetical protein NKOR_06210 [Candidatus Nitrosopumilus koreensis AR1]|uniref:Uncharacterized protein n=1 Tax=Candidatus Nitrosopumilus koreensis AR1 TaxID=1229908 RepID=K0B4M1_9ARCH|nr:MULTISPECIES: hypothetical protein [Nitrosopumilus]AFS81123.1 hypothetical protein NKOR_06210 [Candidatus Nitrosopumilus koreensis AR1]
MKTRILIMLGIIGVTLAPFVFLNADASCDKQVGTADESCTPDELLEICRTLWSPRYDGSATPGNIFCRAVDDLDLNEDDVRKLGIHLDWENYAIQSSKDFIGGWGFYQDNAIQDTLQIHPSISMRNSLPPDMKVKISFDYVDESEIKRFDESMDIYLKYNPDIIPLPENTWVIMPSPESKRSLPTNQLDEMCENGQALCQPRNIMHGPNILASKTSSEDVFLAVLASSLGVSFIVGIIYWWKRK